MQISMIVAHSENHIIGKGTQIPFRVQGEQQLFKRITTGKVLLVGNTTFKSMGKLEDRKFIVVSRTPQTSNDPDVFYAPSISTALFYAKSVLRVDELVVIGGGSIYEKLLPFVDNLYVSKIHKNVDGDVMFPQDISDFEPVISTEIETNERYTFTWLRRVKKGM